MTALGARIEAPPSRDHRNRRADGRRQGHLGAPARAALEFAYLDSGSLYRAVAARLLALGADTGDQARAVEIARSLRLEDLADPRLRDEAVSQAASEIAAMAPVRTALLAWQRTFATNPPDQKSGRRSGRPGYRHRGLSGSKNKALRDGLCRGPRPAPTQGVARSGRGEYIRARLRGA